MAASNKGKGKQQEAYRSQGSGRLISDRYRAELEADGDSSRKSLSEKASRTISTQTQVPVPVAVAVSVGVIGVVLGVWFLMGRTPAPVAPRLDPTLEESLGLSSIWAFGAVMHAQTNDGVFPPAGWGVDGLRALIPESERGGNYTNSPYDAGNVIDGSDFYYHPPVPSIGEVASLNRRDLVVVVDRAALEQGIFAAAFLDGSSSRVSRDRAAELLQIEQNAWLETELGLRASDVVDPE